MKELAEHELNDSAKMRESLFVSRERARNVLKAQHETTEHTIRKRVFETQRARNELEWQMVKVGSFNDFTNLSNSLSSHHIITILPRRRRRSR